MVHFSLPSESMNSFLQWSSLLEYILGPFGPDDSSLQELLYECYPSDLIQGVMSHGERDVTHVKMDGLININPYHHSMEYTDSHTGNFHAKVGNSKYSIPCTFLPKDQVLFLGQYSYSSDVFASTFVDSLGLHLVEALVNHTNHQKCRVFRHQVVALKFSSDTMSVTKIFRLECTETAYPPSLPFSLDEASLDDIQTIPEYFGEYAKATYLPVTDSIPRKPYYGYDPSIISAINEIGLLVKDIPCVRKFSSLRDFDFGALALEACSDLTTNSVNMIEFLRDLRHPTELIPKFKNFRTFIKNASKIDKSKAVSDEYLRTVFGILPTVSDIKSIVDQLRKNLPYYDPDGFQITTSVKSVHDDYLDWHIHQVARAKVVTSRTELYTENSMDKLKKMGVFPSLNNLWDLVPYSFVVDWFTSVGDTLEIISDYSNAMSLGIRYCTFSRKDILSHAVIATDNSYYGEIQVVNYHRWTTDHCPTPQLSTDPSSNVSLDKLSKGTALLIQRIK